MTDYKKGKIRKLLKDLAVAATALSAVTGAILGVNSVYEAYRAKKGYKEQVEAMEERDLHIQKNREEIRFLYRTLLSTALRGRKSRRRKPKVPIRIGIQKKYKQLPKVRRRRYRRWRDLLIQRKK